jgi:thiol-disulfide isomerase/thioredoxin
MTLKKNSKLITTLIIALAVAILAIAYLVYTKRQPTCPQQGPPPPKDGGKPAAEKPSAHEQPADTSTFINGGKPALVLFYGNRCGPSRAMLPDWEKVVAHFSREGSMTDVVTIEEAEHKEEMAKNQIKGLPTIRYYPSGYPSNAFVEFPGNAPRQAELMIKFAEAGGKLGP